MNREIALEGQWIAAAASGNLGAFSQLVHLHRSRVLRVAYGILGSIEAAEDVAQEVFIKAWNALPNYHQHGSFSTWLYRITANTAIDMLRRDRITLPLEDIQELPVEETAEQTLLRNEGRRQVMQAVAALPPAARTTLILREYEQLSYKEIADILQVPVGTVMSRLNYARNALRKALELDAAPRSETVDAPSA